MVWTSKFSNFSNFFFEMIQDHPNVHWIDLKSAKVVCSFPLVNNLVTYQNKFWRSLKRVIWNNFKNFRKFSKKNSRDQDVPQVENDSIFDQNQPKFLSSGVSISGISGNSDMGNFGMSDIQRTSGNSLD